MAKTGTEVARDCRLREMQEECLDPLTKAKADEIRNAQEWAIKHAKELGGSVGNLFSRKFTMTGKTRT